MIASAGRPRRARDAATRWQIWLLTAITSPATIAAKKPSSSLPRSTAIVARSSLLV